MYAFAERFLVYCTRHSEFVNDIFIELLDLSKCRFFRYYSFVGMSDLWKDP